MKTKDQIIEALVAALEIPPGAYDKAHDRYKDLGTWFCEGPLKDNKPRIYAQGSFRLGTVIRPLHEGESYDLDVGCRLESGITKHTHTQEKLKTLVGDELEAYRKARQIKKELEEKHRCWCLEYADELRFSEDIVPSIPEEMTKQASLAEAMVKYLYAMSLKLTHGQNFIFGELRHGIDGELDDYKELLGLKRNDQVVPALLCLLKKKRLANKMPCPCSCKKRLGKCDFNVAVRKFRNVLPKAWLREVVTGKR